MRVYIDGLLLDNVIAESYMSDTSEDFVLDEKMFIRLTQASVLCTMLQFSWARSAFYLRD